MRGGPAGPQNHIFAGAFFLLREIEISLATCGHIMVDANQQIVARKRFSLHPDLPLFPTHEGKHCDKSAEMDTIGNLAGWSGQQVRDSTGAMLQSGHTLRVTGARFLSSVGIALSTKSGSWHNGSLPLSCSTPRASCSG